MKQNLITVIVICLVLSVVSAVSFCKTKEVKQDTGKDKKADVAVQPGMTELKSKNYRLVTGPIGSQPGLIKKNVILKSTNYILVPMDSVKEETVLKSTNYQLVPYTTTFFTK
jgi:hypothetical protein